MIQEDIFFTMTAADKTKQQLFFNFTKYIPANICTRQKKQNSTFPESAVQARLEAVRSTLDPHYKGK